MRRVTIVTFGLVLAAETMLLGAKARAQAANAARESQVTFISAQQIDAAARAAKAKLRDGVWYSTFDNNKLFSTGVVRRTFPTFAEEHAGWTDVWYVIRGEGTIVTGGSLIEPKTESAGELRGPGISGGVEHHVAPGDVITVPAGVPHWVSKISSKEIVYLMVKILPEKGARSGAVSSTGK